MRTMGALGRRNRQPATVSKIPAGHNSRKARKAKTRPLPIDGMAVRKLKIGIEAGKAGQVIELGREKVFIGPPLIRRALVFLNIRNRLAIANLRAEFPNLKGRNTLSKEELKKLSRANAERYKKLVTVIVTNTADIEDFKKLLKQLDKKKQ